MAAFNATAKSKLTGRKWLYGSELQSKSIRVFVRQLLGSKSRNVILRRLLSARYIVMGRPPYLRPWHPSWPDFHIMLDEIRRSCTSGDIRALVLSNEPLPISEELRNKSAFLLNLGRSQFLGAWRQLHESSAGTFDLCFIELVDDDMTELPKLIFATVPLLKNSGRIIVSLPTPDALTGTWNTARSARSYMSHYGIKFVQAGVALTAIRPVPAGTLRCMVYRHLGSASARARAGGLGMLWAILEVGLLLGLSLIVNLMTLRQSRSTDPRGANSRLILRLDVSAQNG